MIYDVFKEIARNELRQRGFFHVNPAKLNQSLLKGREEIIKSYWHRLVKDEYLKDNGGYRYRRCGMFKLEDGKLDKIKVKGWYYQNPELNKTNGGVMRKFGPLEDEFADEQFLHDLIKGYFSTLPLSKEQRKKAWRIFVHPFRIVAKPNQPGEGAPEGPHRDGHQYTAQVFIDKRDVYGAESIIYDENMKVVARNTFDAFLEAMILDDQRMYHDVTSLQTNASKVGYRDIFTINFNEFDRQTDSIME